MSCYCGGDYSWEVVSNIWCVARKDHKCIECDKVINKGEKYLKTIGKDTWNGRLGHYPSCELCGRIRTDLIENNGYCIIYGQLWNFIENELESYKE